MAAFPALWAALRERVGSRPDLVMVDVGRFEPLPAHVLDAAEARLGYRLPSAARRLWGEVGNGGFGPGYGIAGLVGGFVSEDGGDAVSVYEAMLAPDPHQPSWRWPPGLLAICDWGCGVQSCVDLDSPNGDMFRFDPNAVADDWNVAWIDEGCDLETWLRRWVDGDELWEADSITPAPDDFIDRRLG